MLCGSIAVKISLEKMLIEHETLEFSRSKKTGLWATSYPGQFALSELQEEA